MSSLEITDLNFWEIELPDKGKVKGGVENVMQVVQIESNMNINGSAVSSTSSYLKIEGSGVSSISSVSGISTSTRDSASPPAVLKSARLINLDF